MEGAAEGGTSERGSRQGEEPARGRGCPGKVAAGYPHYPGAALPAEGDSPFQASPDAALLSGRRDRAWRGRGRAEGGLGGDRPPERAPLAAFRTPRPALSDSLWPRPARPVYPRERRSQSRGDRTSRDAAGSPNHQLPPRTQLPARRRPHLREGGARNSRPLMGEATGRGGGSCAAYPNLGGLLRVPLAVRSMTSSLLIHSLSKHLLSICYLLDLISARDAQRPHPQGTSVVGKEKKSRPAGRARRRNEGAQAAVPCW